MIFHLLIEEPGELKKKQMGKQMADK